MSESWVVAGGGHPVLTVGALVAGAAGEVLSSSGLSLGRTQLQDAMVSLHAAQQSLEAARLHVVRLLADAEDPSLHPGAATRHFLGDVLVIGQGAARADLEAARATDPEVGVLRGMGGALADGRVTRRHVDVARRAVAALPTGLVRERRNRVDELLTEHATTFSPTDAEQLAAYLLSVVDPDGTEDHADEALERRTWSAKVDRTGMVRAEGRLEGAGGARYLSVLHHLAAPGRAGASCGDGVASVDGADDGPVQQVIVVAVDLRTRAQRLADAQVEMARLAAAHLRLSSPADPPRVVVHTTVEQLAWRPAGGGGDAGSGSRRPGAAAPSAPSAPSAEPAVATTHPGPATCEQVGALSSVVLQTMACDAVLERVVLDWRGAVVGVETHARLATRAQRRALAARDGGCAWPGCGEPPSACDAHHVVWWTRGGPTVLTNLVLLCGRHHREAHREQWEVTMRDGVPWFVPPAWFDPAQEPVRNSLHAAIAATLAAGAALARDHQLRLPDVGGTSGRSPADLHRDDWPAP